MERYQSSQTQWGVAIAYSRGLDVTGLILKITLLSISQGSAIVRPVETEGKHTWFGSTRSELDLLDCKAVFDFLAAEKPNAQITAATKVGGIHTNNTYSLQLLTENLKIENNLMDTAHATGIEKLLFLVSSTLFHPPMLYLLITQYDQGL